MEWFLLWVAIVFLILVFLAGAQRLRRDGRGRKTGRGQNDE